MTYRQIIKEIGDLLESHAMIKSVKNVTPTEWLNRDSQPDFPIATYTVNTGTFNKGREQSYQIQFFFLDKDGMENDFEPDIISDQMSIAFDVVEKLRGEKNDWYIDDNVTWNAVTSKYEDYITGVEVTINLTVQSSFDGCNFPT